MRSEAAARGLPVDFIACHRSLRSAPNLIVVKPVLEFTLPFYKQQPIRIPNIMQIHRIFQENEYDRIICSTEGAMGLVAIILKKAFRVPAWFFLHTDWLTYIKMNLKFDIHMINRIRRWLRIFYIQFDGHLVLNGDQKKWLSGKEMGLDRNNIFQTAHWVDKYFKPGKDNRKKLFGAGPNDKILLYAGRVSREKGIMDLPFVYNRLKQVFPDIRLVILGSGPDEEELKKAAPDLIFAGWVDYHRLPEYYSSADLLLLPSVFDTFGRVVLEAMSCGLPVAAYDKMGPRDIIEHEKSGYLVKSKSSMARAAESCFRDKKIHSAMKKQCVKRAASYSADNIIRNLMRDIGIK